MCANPACRRPHTTHDAWLAGLAELSAAVAGARDATRAAQVARDEAASALEEARAGAAEALAGGSKPMPVKAARERLAEADDALDAARAARRLVDDRLTTARGELRAAEGRVRAAALAVLRAELGGELVANAERLRREFVAEAAAIRELHRAGAILGDARIHAIVQLLDQQPANERAMASGADRVQSLIAALEQRPDHPLDRRAA